MISRFDPVPAKECKLKQVPYFTPAVAAAENEILGAYEFPKILDQFILQACEEPSPGYGGHGQKKKFPIAVYSPSGNTTRLFGSGISQEIASHGFTTYSIDHPYDVDITEFPNGDVIYGGRLIKPENMNGSTASVDKALKVRSQDVSFLLDTLGVTKREKVGMFGQSFGGPATATSMFHDKRIRAGVNLDGAMYGPAVNSSLGTRSDPQAFLLWGSTGHGSKEDKSWAQSWKTLDAAPFVDYAKEFTINNTSHGSHWDLGLLVDVAGIRDELSDVAKTLFGPSETTRVYEILGKYLSSFFWYSLGLKKEDDVLKGHNDEFPEVEIVNEK
jgi:dienelactone hydrolase